MAETITSADRAYWPRALPAKQQATSKNYFSVIWVEDFDSEKVLETAEYFVYCAVFKAHLWGKRFAQIPKGEFLEVPNNL